MRHAQKLKNVTIFLTLIIGLALFLTMTNPNDLPVGVLVLPILLVFFASFVGTMLAVDTFRIFPNHKKKRRIIAATIATMMAIAVVLGSAGAIVLGDAVLIFLIVTVALLYISNF